MRRLFAYLLTLALPLVTAGEPPKKLALVMGGAEQRSQPFSFSETFQTVVTKLESAGYTSLHSLIEDKPRIEFTNKGAKGKIKELADELASAPSGSQALIVIESHGAPRWYGGTHKILTSSGELFDVAEFEALQDLAKKKGVRLAILDLSCYSGQSMALAKRDPSTCVITAGSADMVADANFGKELFRNMEKGKSLEASFLAAREWVENGYPAISTAEGLKTAELLDLAHSNTSLYTPDILKSFENKNCDESHLQSQLSDLSKVLRKNFGLEDSQVEAFHIAIQDYISNRQAYQDDESFLNSTEMILGRAVTKRDLLFSNLSGSMKFLDAAEKKREELEKSASERLHQIMMRKSFENGFGYTIGKDKRFWDAARDVALAERSIYRNVYKKLKLSDSNPCRDFQF